MKKYLFSCFICLSLGGYSQITLDFQETGRLYKVKLNNSETKYIDEGKVESTSPDHFILYNLDGSLYKIIQLPAKPDSSAIITTVSCISTSLFDNDPTNIEFLLNYQWYLYPIGNVQKVVVAREDGAVLLNELFATTGYFRPEVYGTEQGTKLMLYYAFPDSVEYETKVFSLPGDPPVNIDREISQTYDEVILYPNPNNGSFSLKINSEIDGVRTISIYGQDGRLVDTFKSSNNQSKINCNHLPNGIYLIGTKSKNSNTITKLNIQK